MEECIARQYDIGSDAKELEKDFMQKDSGLYFESTAGGLHAFKDRNG